MNYRVGCNVTGCLKRHYIEEFISAGPKNHSYRTDIQTTKCKVRGFTLNKCTSMLTNFDFMKEMVTACKNNSKLDRVAGKCVCVTFVIFVFNINCHCNKQTYIYIVLVCLLCTNVQNKSLINILLYLKSVFLTIKVCTNKIIYNDII